MAKKVTFEGKTYTVPDDASDQEIFAYVESELKPAMSPAVGKTPGERAAFNRADPKRMAELNADNPLVHPPKVEGSAMDRFKSGLLDPVKSMGSDVWNYFADQPNWSKNKMPAGVIANPSIPLASVAGRAATGDIAGALGQGTGEAALSLGLNKIGPKIVPGVKGAVKGAVGALPEVPAAIKTGSAWGNAVSPLGLGKPVGAAVGAAAALGKGAIKGVASEMSKLNPVPLTPQQREIALAHDTVQPELRPTPSPVIRTAAAEAELPSLPSGRVPGQPQPKLGAAPRPDPKWKGLPEGVMITPETAPPVQPKLPSGRQVGTGEPKLAPPTKRANPLWDGLIELPGDAKPTAVESIKSPLPSGRVPGSGEPKVEPKPKLTRDQKSVVKGVKATQKQLDKAPSEDLKAGMAPAPSEVALPSGRKPGTGEPKLGPDPKPEVKVAPKKIEQTRAEPSKPRDVYDDHYSGNGQYEHLERMKEAARLKDSAVADHLNKKGITPNQLARATDDQIRTWVKEVNPKYQWRGDNARRQHLSALLRGQ